MEDFLEWWDKNGSFARILAGIPKEHEEMVQGIAWSAWEASAKRPLNKIDADVCAHGDENLERFMVVNYKCKKCGQWFTAQR